MWPQSLETRCVSACREDPYPMVGGASRPLTRHHRQPTSAPSLEVRNELERQQIQKHLQENHVQRGRVGAGAEAARGADQVRSGAPFVQLIRTQDAVGTAHPRHRDQAADGPRTDRPRDRPHRREHQPDSPLGQRQRAHNARAGGRDTSIVRPHRASAGRPVCRQERSRKDV